MLWNSANRPVRTQRALALCAILVLSGCASHYVQVPPRLALAPYGRVALLTFSADQSNGTLGSLATQRFAEALLSSQSGIELIELDTMDSSLRRLAARGDAAALAQALGRSRDVPAVFVGDVKVSGAKPSGRISAGDLKLRASVLAELNVRLLSTQTGGTIWRSSAEANRTVGQVSMGSRLSSISVRDPNDAYGEVVRELVMNVTRDMRPTLVKQ
jgi:hypothetical protein